MSSTKKINLKKERVVLSDLLPYETPITFSNRFFYDFLIANEVSCDDRFMKWKETTAEVEAIICLIFGIDETEKNKIKTKDGFQEYKNDKTFITIPFHYGISHKGNSFRMLSVMHPRNQIQAIDFYEKYKELIIYFSQISNFSLRAPSRIASTRYFNDERKSGSIILANTLDKDGDKKYKNLKSFFGYRKISNIHQFFESNDYHSCEQKYNNMAQLDISKCFDSIYTHSIAWATFGRGIVKNKIATSGNNSLNASFPGDFDKLMQRQNYNETNGILIGPELSRIFAEIILQRVDYNIRSKLSLLNIAHGLDYEAFRYVDDYFIFYNDEVTYKKIVDELASCLNEFKLGLNAEKELIYHKPIITEITIAKSKISQLLSEKIKMETEELRKVSDEEEKFISGKINVQSKPLITQYKMILSESGAEYKSVINYTLAIVENKIKKIFKDYEGIQKTQNLYNGLLKSIHSVVDFCFFIYSVAPKANTTIKLSRVLKIVIDFSRTPSISADDMHQIFKRISDNISFIILKYETSNHTQVETLYLLTVTAELGKDYWIDESSLVKYFGGNYKSKKTVYFENNLNYFSITVLLFYIKNKKRYERVKSALEALILKKIKLHRESLPKNTECLLLALDCMSCPYLDEAFKKKILRLYGIRKNALQEGIVAHKEYWFTKWTDFEFGKELDAKQSEAVY
ncbi:antiviral reverse transcriptase Drt3b [Sedimenticola hydrogenitrophicus]|uniref:antiviral reverse transcriptase Drt3b n=1 Tax=Sedimenticola hydrogenitrophicus TaxID=2967975 RepID=UPI0021A2CCA0|nr:antiviral reverse transcriptase Drt3b [Sedimenticola hydrogenitrophicus]